MHGFDLNDQDWEFLLSLKKFLTCSWYHTQVLGKTVGKKEGLYYNLVG